MKRILVLTAGYGEGHNAAARALGAAFQEAGADVQVRDLFLEVYGEKQEKSRRLYLQCIEHTPWLWALTYHAIDFLPLMRWVISPLLSALQRKLTTVLQEWRPDSVVVVYPGYNHLLDRIYGRQKAPFARHTVVTDSITINSVWYRVHSDSWLVPNQDTALAMQRAQIPPARLHVTGFPVSLVFADREPKRVPPGPNEPLRVLYMINHNRRHAIEIVRALMQIAGVELTVTVGRNAQLGEHLSELAREIGRELDVYGWTDQIPRLLMSHHVMIGKAGGAATQEAIAACTPLLITKIVPGQELGNAQLVERHGCGAVTLTPNAVVEQVQNLIKDNCALWHQWHAEIQGLSRPNAARDTARFILEFESAPTLQPVAS